MFRLAKISSSIRVAQPARLFTTTSIIQKSPLDSAKDAIKNVDRTISDAAVKGIEKGEQATQAAKETVAGKTNEATSDASAKINEASGKAAELKGEAKGKANELAGEAKGKKEEIKGKI